MTGSRRDELREVLTEFQEATVFLATGRQAVSYEDWESPRAELMA